MARRDSIRDHLRGFSRTIPSFLMAYGSDAVTLETFDTIIPDEVFKEVTGITLADFRFLRDGGDYTDSKTNETEHFDGHLFDPVVFDDSVKEFMRLKKSWPTISMNRPKRTYSTTSRHRRPTKSTHQSVWSRKWSICSKMRTLDVSTHRTGLSSTCT